MKLSLLLLIVFLSNAAEAQFPARTYRLDSVSTQTLPSSNSINQILILNGKAYVSTYDALNVTDDGGKSFQVLVRTTQDTSLGTIAIKGDTITMSIFAPDVNVEGSPTQTGGGLYVSTDSGSTWTKEPQSTDSLSDSSVTFGKDTLKALPWPGDVENGTFSLCFYHGILYTANWAGGLRRLTDLGKTWQRVVLPPDNLNYITQDSTYSFQLSVQTSTITDEANFNQEAFSAYCDGDSALYIGTAGGIDKTTDDGYSWYRFSHQNEQSPISGDWVVSIAGNNYGGKHYVWASTLNANDPSEVEALSYSSDGGASWHYIFSGHRFNAIAFQDSILYGASDDGLFRTADFGITNEVIRNIYDPTSKQSIQSQPSYAAATNGDSVWLGSGDGTAMGIDNGNGFDPSQWRIFRAYESVANTNSTYFYPNPFSPNLDVGRIHYNVKSAQSQVTIRIYDFSMHIVRTLLQNAPRNAGETDEQWNGAGDHGGLVDNGVYFYSVVVNGGSPSWGKILVVR